MSADLKPYPAIKDSGVPWLGEVPEHWEERSLGSLTALISQRGRPDLPLLSVVREKGVIVRSMLNDDENHMKATEFSEVMEKPNREIFLLREFRIRLIADVVTGKLDVRAAAANLPEESGELEALDDTDALAEGDEPADGDLDAAPEEAEA